METPVQRCLRVITALEDLAAQEAAALATRDLVSLVSLQDRTEPLIAFLVSAGVESANHPEVRARLEALHSRRDQSSRSLATAMERTRAELQETKVAQGRVARVAPAYGTSFPTRPKLHAVG